jgi:hypothetical protein
VCEAKQRVGSDWLMRSSKLQPCLGLCQFVQTLLKTNDARRKAQFHLRICEKTLGQYSSKQMVYYSRYTTRKKSVTSGVSLLQQVTSWH